MKFTANVCWTPISITLISQVMNQPDSENAKYALYCLIKYSDQWGENLGRKVLEYSGYTPSFKMVAADALTARGVFKEGEPVPMFIDGKLNVATRMLL